MGEKVAIEIRWENDTAGDAPGTLALKASVIFHSPIGNGDDSSD